MNFYNDIDSNACEWTRELIRAGLIPDGIVSDTSITDIKAHELTDFTQAHFFSGICGWPLAFRLAEIPDSENCDTGSCPCQPFSGTGKQMGFADPRHLWPAFRRIAGKRQPAKIYGEQVASKLGREWLARVFSDLAFMGYAGSGADLCSAGVGSPNIRQRLYWVGDAVRAGSLSSTQRGADCSEESRGTRHGVSAGPGAVDRLAVSASVRCGAGSRDASGEDDHGADITGCSESGGLAESNRITREQGNPLAGGRVERSAAGQEPGLGSGRPTHRLGDSHYPRPQGRVFRWDGGDEGIVGATGLGMWRDCELVFCRDEKLRRIEPGSFPLAHGVPSRVGPLLTELRKLGRSSIALARANRNIRLKGYGNAINPFVAAQFIRATAGSGPLPGRVKAPESTEGLCLD